MEPDNESTRKNCDKCGAVFKLAPARKKSVRERQELFPDVAKALEQELICCEDCAVLRIIKLL